MKSFLIKNPIVVTSDVDWASEYCISSFVECMLTFKIKPLLFVTHESKLIQQYLKEKKISVGIHPNFFKGSDHGEKIDEVIKNVLKLAATSKISRSHRFKDSNVIQNCLVKNKILYDSNKLEYLTSNLTPSLLDSKIVRFPVFWSDGFEMRQPEISRWNILKLEKKFSTNGLKIINIHPFNFTLNFSNVFQYNQMKHMTKKINRSNISIYRNKINFGVSDFINHLFYNQNYRRRVINPEELTNGRIFKYFNKF